jgi:hypothetical protein
MIWALPTIRRDPVLFGQSPPNSVCMRSGHTLVWAHGTRNFIRKRKKFQHIVIFNKAKTVASGKSKGALFVSAKQQINHIIIKGNKGVGVSIKTLPSEPYVNFSVHTALQQTKNRLKKLIYSSFCSPGLLQLT